MNQRKRVWSLLLAVLLLLSACQKSAPAIGRGTLMCIFLRKNGKKSK